jgi:acyl carrier protein
MIFTEQMISELADLLEIDEKDLTLDYVFPEEWNSLVIIGIIAMVDEHFNKILDLNQLQKCRNLRDLSDLISEI